MNTLPAVIQSKSFASRWAHYAREHEDKDLKWAAQRQYAQEIFASTPSLSRCVPESIETALMDVAFSGLSLSPTLRHAYLIPWQVKGVGLVCRFSPSYLGMEHMVLRAGTVTSIQAGVVYEGDKFRVWTENGQRHILHEENWGKREPVMGAWCIAHYTNGGRHVETMTAAELDGCAQAAARLRQDKQIPWTWDPKRNPHIDEMRKKAVVRRAAKHWPRDGGGVIERSLEIMDRNEPMTFEPVEDAEPQEQEMLISEESQLEIHAWLVDAGLEPGAADRWLAKLAKAFGLRHFSELPERRVEEARDRLRDGLEKISEQKEKLEDVLAAIGTAATMEALISARDLSDKLPAGMKQQAHEAYQRRKAEMRKERV